MIGTVAWALDALIASALLMVAVLLVRAPVRRAFGPQLAYALWALPALRLVLPPLPEGWWLATAAPITRAGETVATVLILDVTAPVADEGSLPLGLALTVVWAAGMAGFLLWHLVRHARFCRAVVRTGEPLELRDGIRVIASAAAPGPLAFGIWRRYVAFPRDFAERFDADERALALAHELGHHARRDLLANWAALVVLALHWFNPLAWRAFHAFRADQELANDARVLAGCAPTDRHAYGRAIVKAAHGKAISATCHLHTIADLKGRLKMLTMSRASRRRLAAGSAAVTLLVTGGLGLTASGTAAERITATLDVPLQPVPPVAIAATEPELAQVPPVTPVPPIPGTARKKRVVIVNKDGETTTYQGADADKYIAENDLPIPPVPPVPPVAALPGEKHVFVRRLHAERGKDGKPTTWRTMDIPEVTSVHCPGDTAKPLVENSTKDGKRRIVICTNRIEAMSKNAERLAMNGADFERRTMLSARSSLALARNAVERDRNLSDEQRAQALAGIAQAEAEVRTTN